MTQSQDKNFASMERDGWADADTAQHYARFFAKAAEQCVPELVKQARIAPGAEVLDACCGHGIVAEGLVAAGARVTALDFSDAMLDLARARAPQATLVHGDATALPFETGQFSAVTNGFGMPHIPEPPKALAEARRVLRKGGRLSYSVWQGEGAQSAMAYVFEAIGEHGDPSVRMPPAPGPHDYCIPDIALPALEAAGFEDVEMHIVASEWQIADPDAPVDIFRNGTVRGAALLHAQPKRNAVAIRKSVVDKVLAEHGNSGPWTVPIPAVIVSATAI
ncbi:MAG: methyltransferase domain-containing protein [Marinosulfonomonas sp.]|nr:methyltransferase domain-containing protein [Marinosulfonomonas sp.]